MLWRYFPKLFRGHHILQFNFILAKLETERFQVFCKKKIEIHRVLTFYIKDVYHKIDALRNYF